MRKNREKSDPKLVPFHKESRIITQKIGGDTMAHLEKKDIKQAIRSGLIGLAIGDALGVPIEFLNRNFLELMPVTEMLSVGTHHQPAGTWSDDTSMTICLIQSLIDQKCFHYHDIMENFVKWYLQDEFTATKLTFDIGGTCKRAIENYLAGGHPVKCGMNHYANNGNGSLMRILPVAFVCHRNQITGEKRFELVKNISSLTHAHPISVLGCLIYTNFVCHLLGGDNPKEAYRKTQLDDYSMFEKEEITLYSRILKNQIYRYPKGFISSRAYVVDTLEAALWSFLTTDNFQDAVLTAVNLGDDTDTVGALTGSLAGIQYGLKSIPEKWVTTLKRGRYLVKLCDQFAETEIDTTDIAPESTSIPRFESIGLNRLGA